MFVLQHIQFPKIPAAPAPSSSAPPAGATWPRASSSQLEALGSLLTVEAEKMEAEAAGKTKGTKRAKEAASTAGSGEEV